MSEFHLRAKDKTNLATPDTTGVVVLSYERSVPQYNVNAVIVIIWRFR